VTNIGESAFAGCADLIHITISQGVLNIGEDTFSDSGLTSVAIPESITNMGLGSFFQCYDLTAINVDANNSIFSSTDGVLFNKNGTVLIQYPGGKVGPYLIPQGVTSIGESFNECLGLTAVTIPNSVTNVGAAAFYVCLGLASVSLPDNITSIGDQAFWLCTNLTSVAIPNSVTNIGQGAFYSCSRLASAPIPKNLTSIAADTFALTALTNVLIPNGVTSIGSEAFLLCSSLTNVTFPNSLTDIGYTAFANCGMTNITIPESVTNLEDYAFYGCTNLTGAYFEGNAPSADSTVFSGDSSTIAYFLSETTGWSEFLAETGVPTALWIEQTPLVSASPGVKVGQFGFTINGTSNLVVMVEACTSLAKPIWSPVATNTLTDGSSYFSDPHWTNYHGRFYRVVSP
jgi:hypothetical protein